MRAVRLPLSLSGKFEAENHRVLRTLVRVLPTRRPSALPLSSDATRLLQPFVRFTVTAAVLASLGLWPPLAHAEQVITCGQPLVGNLETDTQSDVVEFEGTAGDTVWLSIQTTYRLDLGFQARVELRRPDGNWHSSTLATAVSTLPVTGRYTLRVDDGSTPAGVRRGAYKLRLEWLGPSAKVCGAQSVECGAMLANALAQRDQALYQFEGSAGDAVWLSIATVPTTNEDFDPAFRARVELRRPDGNWQTSTLATSVVALPVNGTYLLRVHDGSTTTQMRQGSYVLRIEWLGPAGKVCQARHISCARDTVDTLLEQDQDLYWFDANAGDRLTLSLSRTAQAESNFAPRLEVFRPDGRWFTGTLATVTGTAPISGRYTVRIWDYVTGTQRGGYYSLRFDTTGQCGAVAVSPRVVRFVYLVPTNREINTEFIRLIERRAQEFRLWLREHVGGATYRLHDPVVEVYRLSRPDSYYAGQRDPGAGFWIRAYSDARAVAGARRDDPDVLWVVYVDARNACHQGGGAGAPGVAILPRDDLLKPTFDVCDQVQDTKEERWTGGMGHELLHAFGLLHPPGCDENEHTCDQNALMWLGYRFYPRGTWLQGDEVTRLRQSPFIHIDVAR